MVFIKEELLNKIKDLINSGKIYEAEEIIGDYELAVGEDDNLYNLKGIINLIDNKLELSQYYFEKALLNREDFDIRYNLAYVYALLGDFKKLKDVYSYVIRNYSRDKVDLLDEMLLENKVDLNKLEKIERKTKVLFLPYKITMWDSLESIYKAAIKNKNLEVQLLPIPYYELRENSKNFCYEGDRFPYEIMDYREYNLNLERPDIIFVHNIYDDKNTITQVAEDYFTSNLKKYTDRLVYIPYHFSSVIEKPNVPYYEYIIPNVKNVDKVIVSRDIIFKEALKKGFPKNKFTALGSPKIDYIVNKKEEHEEVEGKFEFLRERTVFLLNTGVMFFTNNIYKKVELISRFLTIPGLSKNTALIWRPHPLTEAAIKNYNPYFLNFYKYLIERIDRGYYSENIVFDKSDDYLPALKISDAIISDVSSLLTAGLILKKPIIYFSQDGFDNVEKKNDKVFNSFYNISSKDVVWYEPIKKIAQGQDDLKENREKILKNLFVNTDGSSGEKILNYILSDLYGRKQKY